MIDQEKLLTCLLTAVSGMPCNYDLTIKQAKEVMNYAEKLLDDKKLFPDRFLSDVRCETVSEVVRYLTNRRTDYVQALVNKFYTPEVIAEKDTEPDQTVND